MLSPFLRRHLAQYDEAAYRISPEDCAAVLAANSQFAEDQRLDVRIPSASRWRVARTLRAAGVLVRRDAVIVDLCCGTGYVARSLIAEDIARAVVGLDISWSQLKLLRTAAVEWPERIPIVQANTLKLPFARGSVDLIVGNSFLHHFPDVPAALAEIRRALAPGGRLVVLHEPSTTATFFESFPLSLFKRVVVANYTDLWQFEPDSLRRLLQDAGFDNVRVRATGVLTNLILGAPSIVANKFFPRADALHLGLDYLRAALTVAEYRFSWPLAPSLLVDASTPPGH